MVKVSSRKVYCFQLLIKGDKMANCFATVQAARASIIEGKVLELNLIKEF
jgi:hypothetical protein